MINFKRPKNELPYYYASTVVNGKLIDHEGDEKYAVYLSEITESSKRANFWHRWVAKKYKKAYNSIGVIDENIIAKNSDVLEQFMNGDRVK